MRLSPLSGLGGVFFGGDGGQPGGIYLVEIGGVRFLPLEQDGDGLFEWPIHDPLCRVERAAQITQALDVFVQKSVLYHGKPVAAPFARLLEKITSLHDKLAVHE
ncbi:hypothetical protein D3C79_35750 [compost metagenome]